MTNDGPRYRKKKKPSSRTVSRSAVTGRFVKPSYAKKHPKTTVKERVPVGKPRKGK